MSAPDKLREAKFFIELLHALEERGHALSNHATPAQEASYLFSAILNAFYSALVIVEESSKVHATEFRAAHKEIYAHAKKDGVRAVTVHKQHVPVTHSGYIPPAGNNVILPFRDKPKLVPEAKLGDLTFKSLHYVCLPRDWSIVHALEFCEEHYPHLERFVISHTSVAKQGI